MYVCPHCGANDSSYCRMLPPQNTARPYADEKLERARSVGCRVAHYIDVPYAHERD